MTISQEKLFARNQFAEMCGWSDKPEKGGNRLSMSKDWLIQDLQGTVPVLIIVVKLWTHSAKELIFSSTVFWANQSQFSFYVYRYTADTRQFFENFLARWL